MPLSYAFLHIMYHVTHLKSIYRTLLPLGERLEDWPEDMDLRLNAAVKSVRDQGIVKPQDTVIIVTGSLAGTGSTNTMQVFKVCPSA